MVFNAYFWFGTYIVFSKFVWVVVLKVVFIYRGVLIGVILQYFEIKINLDKFLNDRLEIFSNLIFTGNNFAHPGTPTRLGLTE